jgi:hypothetical protein
VRPALGSLNPIPLEERTDLIISGGNGFLVLAKAGPLPLVPTALVNVLGDLRIEPSEGQHRHTAGGFLAIPHEVLALDPTRERAIEPG